MYVLLLLLLMVCIPAHGEYVDEELLYDDFPADFVWGAATSAYQVEGGYNADGKGESIWDRWTHTPGHVVDNTTGDVACDSYHKIQEDVDILRDLNVSSYRFSISWSRVLPVGTGTPNQPGIDYYNNLIDALIQAGISPSVTLYHWDLPQALEDQDGWLSPQIADWFEEYARLCFTQFGDRVKMWITINEPWVVASNGYGYGGAAPGVYGPGTTVYQAGHNLIKAHAAAYSAYDSDFRPTQEGVIGITLNVHWAIPYDDSPESVEAVDRYLQFFLGWFANPILINGDYPEIMKTKIAEKSELQGFNESRLPEFTTEETSAIVGTSDFLGINFYTAELVREEIFPLEDVSYNADQDVVTSKDPTWYTSGSGWLTVVPFGLRKMMTYVKDQYGDVPVFITENGFSDKAGNLDDLHRLYYYKHYLNQLLKAILLDGCDVRGYFAWSLMDNFEWGSGFTEKFGIHYVNFSDPSLARVQKESARYYSSIVSANGFVSASGPCSN